MREFRFFARNVQSSTIRSRHAPNQCFTRCTAPVDAVATFRATPMGGVCRHPQLRQQLGHRGMAPLAAPYERPYAGGGGGAFFSPRFFSVWMRYTPIVVGCANVEVSSGKRFCPPHETVARKGCVNDGEPRTVSASTACAFGRV